MLLRASGQAQGGSDIDVAVVAAAPETAADSQIEHASELLAFADAVIAGSPEDIAGRRHALADKIGSTALVDAAAVIGNFQRMNRIADATGIPLDTPVRIMAADIGQRIGADRFESAVNSPPVGALARRLGPLLRPVALRLAGLVSRSVRRKIAE